MSMRRAIATALTIGFLALTGCGSEAPVPAQESSPSMVEVAPQDFAVTPCAATPEGTACLIVHAGGKTVLIGAPEGAMASLKARGVSLPDMVMLPDLMPASLEGLLRLRNVTWAEGRRTPLPVIGPVGTGDVIAHLNAAFVVPDAELYTASAPAGGFEAALIAAGDAPPADGFDTGDLRVETRPTGAGALAFHVHYDGLILVLGTCEPPAESDTSADLILAMSCDGAARQYVWPFQEKLIKLEELVEE